MFPSFPPALTYVLPPHLDLHRILPSHFNLRYNPLCTLIPQVIYPSSWISMLKVIVWHAYVHFLIKLQSLIFYHLIPPVLTPFSYIPHTCIPPVGVWWVMRERLDYQFQYLHSVSIKICSFSSWKKRCKTPLPMIHHVCKHHHHHYHRRSGSG